MCTQIAQETGQQWSQNSSPWENEIDKPLARVIRKGEQNKISNIKKGHRSIYSTASQRELIIKNSFVLTYLATPWQRNDQTSFKKNNYMHTKKKNSAFSQNVHTNVSLGIDVFIGKFYQTIKKKKTMKSTSNFH